MFFDSNFIKMNDSHKYFDIYGKEYTPVSTVLKSIVEPFNEKMMASRVAAKEGKTVEEVIAQWDMKRISAADYGTDIHGVLEKYYLTGILDDERLTEVVNKLDVFFRPYKVLYPETIFFDEKRYIAGTSDMPALRSKYGTSKKTIIDIFDYKTNAKGISYFSGKQQDENVNFYNKFMFEPVSHLEDTTYNKYALQLSLYGLLAENDPELQVGRLGIFHISPSFQIKMIPVPYLKYEAMMVMDRFKELKHLPN
jgi:hypothetical protein